MPRMPVDAMAVGVFGHLDADERVWARDEDCYSVFHALSAALGHLSPAAADDRRAVCGR